MPMLKKIKILLIEDNEDERMFMKEGFHSTGLYEVVAEADNGDHMIEFFTTRNIPAPEVVMSDLNMPGRNGYEVIIDIKTNTSLSHIPVIILSSAPLKPYADRCKKLGA